jgi:hypothetical protein
MLDKLMQVLNQKVSDTVKFEPEIKIKREADTLYISEVRKTKINFMVVVEVFRNHGKNDKAPIPVGALSEIAMKAIYIRLSV